MRQRKRWRMKTAARLTIALTIYATAIGATTIERMPLGKLAQAAPVIVRAQCTGNSAIRDAGEIWTLTTFAVEETWRGETPIEITVRLLGGSMGEITSHVAGVPRFRPGEDVVLFLEPTKRGDFSVVSWEQGTFRIRREARAEQALVTQDTASFATFDPATRRFQTSGIRNMRLEDFRARVVAAVQGTGGAKP